MTRPNDDGLERRLGWILRGGVIASSALLAAGLVLSVAHGFGVGTSGPLLERLGATLIRAGVIVLLATPIARVAASAISYVVSRDWMFVVLTSVVLIELAAAVVAAISG